MQGIMDQIMYYNGIVNSFVWGAPVLILLVGTGVYLTLLLGLPQFRYFFAALSEVFSFRKKSGEDKSISSFAAMATAMAATVGTGNVAGVATALHLGGPGAMVWMLISECVRNSQKLRLQCIIDRKTLTETGAEALCIYLIRAFVKSWEADSAHLSANY